MLLLTQIIEEIKARGDRIARIQEKIDS